MLLFYWNNLGFNDVPANPNLRNGTAGQTQQAIANNLIANGAVDYMNLGLLFIFPDDADDVTIRTWARNVLANLPWYEIQYLFV